MPKDEQAAYKCHESGAQSNIKKKVKDNVSVYSGISSIHVTASRIFAV